MGCPRCLRCLQCLHLPIPWPLSPSAAVYLRGTCACMRAPQPQCRSVADRGTNERTSQQRHHSVCQCCRPTEEVNDRSVRQPWRGVRRRGCHHVVLASAATRLPCTCMYVGTYICAYRAHLPHCFLLKMVHRRLHHLQSTVQPCPPFVTPTSVRHHLCPFPFETRLNCCMRMLGLCRVPGTLICC